MKVWVKRIPIRNWAGAIIAYAIVDPCDRELAEFKWYVSIKNGAFTGVHRTVAWKEHETLHRVILGLIKGDGLEGDHINGDVLNNRRKNLRVVTHTQNTHNVRSRGGTSEFRGVYWDSHRLKWATSVHHEGKSYSLGRYYTEMEAAIVVHEWLLQNKSHYNPARNGFKS